MTEISTRRMIGRGDMIGGGKEIGRSGNVAVVAAEAGKGEGAGRRGKGKGECLWKHQALWNSRCSTVIKVRRESPGKYVSSKEFSL